MGVGIGGMGLARIRSGGSEDNDNGGGDDENWGVGWPRHSGS